MGPFAGRLAVAFEPSSVCGAIASRGLGGQRLKSLSRVPLPPGALVPGSTDATLVRPDLVRDALARVVRELGIEGRRACIVLPDGIARAVVLEPPRGVEPREYARFRLGPGLPYPETEALVDVLALGRGRVLAAALRRTIAAEYEAAAAAAGLKQSRLDLAPLVAVAARLKQGVGPGFQVDVILGEAAVSLAAFRDGALAVFRCRRREPGADDSERIADEVDRTAALAGNGTEPVLRVQGAGAAALARRLARAGKAAEVGPPWVLADVPEEAAELSWLGAVLG